MSPCRQAKMIGFNEGGDSAVRYHRKPASALTHEIDFPCPILSPAFGRRLGQHEPHSRVSEHAAMAGDHQTRHEFTGTMGCPFLQPKAFPNSSKFCTVPFTRHSPGECGSVSADCRADCSVWFWHHTCAKPMKYRCASV